MSALVLLDLSAAFDTVDHTILLQRLEVSFGIRDSVLAWFRSYLLDRMQFVRLNGSCSSIRPVRFGVPQGSVLGPILFLLYTFDVPRLIESHGLSSHSYADDVQLYGHCSPAESTALELRLSRCLDDVSAWMSSNHLQLNTAKTEVLWCATARRRSQFPMSALRVGDDFIFPSASVRSLGAYLDRDLSLSTHVTRVVSGCFGALRQLR